VVAAREDLDAHLDAARNALEERGIEVGFLEAEEIDG
jgi:hypothetical protein